MEDADQTTILEAHPDTGLVTARDPTEKESEEIARPGRTIAGLMWLYLVFVMGLVMVASAGTLLFGYLLPADDTLTKPETVVLVYTGAQSGLLGLFAIRPNR